MTYISDSGYGIQSAIGTNSTTTVTTSFTGTAEQNPFPDVMCSCYSDVAGTLFFDFSVNGTDWRTFPTAGFAVGAGIHEFHTAVKGPRYFRVRWTSGSTPSTLQLYTYYGTYRQPNSPLNQSIGIDASALVTRPTSAQDDITRGLRTGVQQWNMFGYRDNLTSAGGEETIFASGNNLVIMTSAETFDISYNNATDGAGGGATGATQLTFYYLDENERLAVAQHTLGSSGSDTTSFSGLGINRCVVTQSGSSNTNVNNITITNTTSGNDQGFIPALSGVAQQAFFFSPNNATAVTKWLDLNVNRNAGGAAPIVRIKGYVYSRTVDCTFEVFRYIMDTNIEEHVTFTDPCNFPLSPRDVLYFVADTDRNSTEIQCRFSLNLYDNV